MLNKSGDIIYIGKAKNLKNRITSYFRNKNHTNRIKRMVSQIDRIETTITPSEEDALLLENIQIKKHRPRFNILLRDDKSYPYIYINDSHDFPRISFFRGVKKKSGNFYGPFSSVYAVRNTINILQKLFKIRPCTDYFFKNRSRPCLQYQIKRCSAPCVNLISKKNYQNDISLSTKFLEGKSDEIIKILIKKMDIASNSLEYEYAATCRDQIESLRHTCKENSINSKYGDIDIEIPAQTATTEYEEDFDYTQSYHKDTIEFQQYMKNRDRLLKSFEPWLQGTFTSSGRLLKIFEAALAHYFASADYMGLPNTQHEDYLRGDFPSFEVPSGRHPLYHMIAKEYMKTINIPGLPNLTDSSSVMSDVYGTTYHMLERLVRDGVLDLEAGIADAIESLMVTEDLYVHGDYNYLYVFEDPEGWLATNIPEYSYI